MSSRIPGRAWTGRVPLAVAAASLFVLHVVSVRAQTGAQSAAQQIINDAAAALGGKERLLAVKTLMIEGGGHDFQVDQEFAYDELGSQFLAYQLRDYKRSFDLVNRRGRFEQVRESQFTIFNGERPQQTIQALDGDIAFNIGGEGSATRVFQVTARHVEYLRHP